MQLLMNDPLLFLAMFILFCWLLIVGLPITLLHLLMLNARRESEEAIDPGDYIGAAEERKRAAVEDEYHAEELRQEWRRQAEVAFDRMEQFHDL